METERKSRYELFLEEEARKAQPTKRCSKCGEMKALGEFYKCRRGIHGRAADCKVCHGKYGKGKKGGRKYNSREDRFWKSFHSRTERNGDCLEWRGAYHSGIPSCRWEGKDRSLRRVVYSLTISLIDLDGPTYESGNGLRIFMTCRNKQCVSRYHMKLGLPEEHEIYRQSGLAIGVRNGNYTHPEKRPRGESATFSKLTDAKVREIRCRAGSVSKAQLAREYDVAHSTIRDVISRRRWAHVQ